MQKTYGYNNKEVPLEQLPEQLQKDIRQAEDFYKQLDNAKSYEERKQICENHPANK